MVESILAILWAMALTMLRLHRERSACGQILGLV